MTSRLIILPTFVMHRRVRLAGVALSSWKNIRTLGADTLPHLNSWEPTSYSTGGSGTGRNRRSTHFFPFRGWGSRVGDPVLGRLGPFLRLR